MHKTIKSLLIALALASTSLAAQANVDLSANVVDVTADLYDYSSSPINHTFTLANAAQAGLNNNFFSDKYTFTLGESNDVSGLLTSLITASNTGLAITSFDLIGSNGFVLAGSQKSSNNALEQSWGFNSGLRPLVAGSYTLQVNGYVVAADGGSYSGNIGVSPVPEADTYAMLLAGLGLVGVVARRRKVAVAA
ncbi:FxDxF family PEP-CTERM protein [Rugamonas sp. CCM 8940]|uniref:FxDxF family PEP-CTERM protein n=1 Tax=Rugamonas sp. CCM 8940 TaxID=2765359 RepID=UPI0018F46623|nr:FxDxF family PEP-CTERM protein [Rugamonas sp. CCM 8940]MBJ7311435.1 PEP-CTERM sorting domain-containing protein [Rugamonas sp. CCM 8940]